MKSNIAENDEEETNDDSLHELIIVKKELKKSENSRTYIESEYFKCEKELRSKTEENEKLKTLIKDLKQRSQRCRC